jgi:hypothetical protein
MAWEHRHKALQVAAAALGIPAAAAGVYTAYQTFCSNEGVCQQLRGTILTTMEKNVPAETKHALLRKDVADFDQRCGNSDSDAKAIFQAALQSTDPFSRQPSSTRDDSCAAVGRRVILRPTIHADRHFRRARLRRATRVGSTQPP